MTIEGMMTRVTKRRESRFHSAAQGVTEVEEGRGGRRCYWEESSTSNAIHSVQIQIHICIQIQIHFFYKYTQCNRSNLSNLPFVLNVKSKTMCSREVVGGVRATAGGKEREREVIKKWEERALSTSHTHPPTPSYLS